jgi:heme-degrading monooxygenase HmoA
VAVFTTVRTEEQSGYSETNARMEDLVKDVPGFLGMDHAQTPGGLGITVGYFRNADALSEWRTNAEHRAARTDSRLTDPSHGASRATSRPPVSP